KKAVLQVAIKRNEGGVILLRGGRALLEIKRKDRKTVSHRFLLRRTARETEKLKKLPAELAPIPKVSDNGISKVKLYGFGGRVAKRWLELRSCSTIYRGCTRFALSLSEAASSFLFPLWH